jgi:hypothetical protein
MQVEKKERVIRDYVLTLTEEEAHIVTALFGALSLHGGSPEARAFANTAFDRMVSTGAGAGAGERYVVNSGAPIVLEKTADYWEAENE